MSSPHTDLLIATSGSDALYIAQRLLGCR